ncbi:unnamed protein product, partial [Cladocopium goreaui]
MADNDERPERPERPARADQTPEERLQYMSRKLADRLGNIEGRQDLLYYFIDTEHWVPVSVLLMDKSLRRTAFRDAPSIAGASQGHSAFQYVLRAAEAHEDLSISTRRLGASVRLNAVKLPEVVEEVKRRVDAATPAVGAALEVTALKTTAASELKTVAQPAEEPVLGEIDMNVTKEDLDARAPRHHVQAVESSARNCKGELGHLLSKRLQRPTVKDDIRYETWKVSEARLEQLAFEVDDILTSPTRPLGHVPSGEEQTPLEAERVHGEKDQVPSFKAQCILLGETYESRQAHGNKKAAEQVQQCPLRAEVGEELGEEEREGEEEEKEVEEEEAEEAGLSGAEQTFGAAAMAFEISFGALTGMSRAQQSEKPFLSHFHHREIGMDVALVALEALQNEPPDEKDGAQSVTTSANQEVIIDYKGQLIQLFQSLGKSKEVRFD